ncbi:MAG: hypothetical protein ACKVZH_22905 [Blastocatellia bacterium]
MKSLTRKYQNASVISLCQGFALLPLTEELFDELAAMKNNQQEVRDEQFFYLCSRTIEAGKLFSLQTPIAYVETDYFGGVGTQGSVVWVSGELIFGPVVTAEQGTLVGDRSEYAINAALRRIGATKENCLDEFEAIGLDARRSNDDWIKKQRDL